MITHLVRVPRQPVSLHVENLWLVRGRFPRTRSALLPDGAMVVMFNLGEPQRLCEGGAGGGRMFRASWVAGLQREPIVFEQAGNYHMAGIRFRPGGAAAIFGFSLAELTGRVVELGDIRGSEAELVREQLADVAGDDERLARLEGWLAQRLRDATLPDRRIGLAAARLQEGGTGIARIAEETAWSHKHLVHEFTRRVGLAPKHFGRVQRLQRAIRQIGFAARVDWADLAVASGFYDQAHLINEFRALAGLTPSDYLTRRSSYLGYLSVA